MARIQSDGRFRLGEEEETGAWGVVRLSPEVGYGQAAFWVVTLYILIPLLKKTKYPK